MKKENEKRIEQLVIEFKGNKKQSKLVFNDLMTHSIGNKPHILAQTESEFINFQTDEIIGRDITLETILKYLTIKDFDVKYKIELLSKWDLEIPLHLQSEPTISFLYDLIVKNK